MPTNTQALRLKLRKRLPRPGLPASGGWTGNSSGVIEVPDRPGYIYVTDWNGIEHVAYNNLAPLNQSSMVRFGRDPRNPSRLIVTALLSPWDDSMESTFPPHHHLWPNGRYVDWIDGIQFLPGLVLAISGTMTVRIYPFSLPMADGTRRRIAFQTLDLTSYIPATGAQWAVICFSQDDGTVSVQLGDPVAGLITLDTTDTPARVTDTVQLAAVAVYGGQSQIVQTSSRNDIRDLRFIGGTGFGNVFGPGSATDGNLAVFDGTTGKLIKDGGPVPTGGSITRFSGTLVQTKNAQANTTSLSVALTSTPIAGHVLVAIIGNTVNATNTMTQTNVTWTKACELKVGSVTVISIWVGVVGASPSGTITVGNGSGYVAATVTEWTGLTGTCAQYATGTYNAPQCTKGLTASANSLIVGGVVVQTGGGVTIQFGGVLDSASPVDFMSVFHRAAFEGEYVQFFSNLGSNNMAQAIAEIT